MMVGYSTIGKDNNEIAKKSQGNSHLTGFKPYVGIHSFSESIV